jgi:hypothetical protein
MLFKIYLVLEKLLFLDTKNQLLKFVLNSNKVVIECEPNKVILFTLDYGFPYQA